MGRHILQILGSDGCLYAYDADTKTLKKICEVSILEVPADVIETLQAAGLTAVKKSKEKERW